MTSFEGQCDARKPDPPQRGEQCALLKHADWMPHSWVPWSLAVRMQAENRPRIRRVSDNRP